MARKTSFSAFVLATGSTIAQFATMLEDGTLVSAANTVLDIDPTTATYVPAGAVGTIGRKSGTLTVKGDVVSARALRKAIATVDSWKADRGEMTLLEMLAHPVFGKTAPTIDTIINTVIELELAA